MVDFRLPPVGADYSTFKVSDPDPVEKLKDLTEQCDEIDEAIEEEGIPSSQTEEKMKSFFNDLNSFFSNLENGDVLKEKGLNFNTDVRNSILKIVGNDPPPSIDDFVKDFQTIQQQLHRILGT